MSWMHRLARDGHTLQPETNVYALPLTTAGGKEPGGLLDFIHLDYLRDSSGNWIYRPATEFKLQTDQAYSEYSFTVIKEWDDWAQSFELKVDIYNSDLRRVLRQVIGEVKGATWNAVPTRVEPVTLLTCYPGLKGLLDDHYISGSLSSAEKHLELLIKYLDTEHQPTLRQVQSLQDHLEVTFDLLWYILVPRTLFYLPCPISGEPRVASLVSATKVVGAFNKRFWSLTLEYTEFTGLNAEDDTPAFGLANMCSSITYFNGARKITSLPTFPLKFHPKAADLEERLIERGQKWASLNGCHHKRYDGLAYEESTRIIRVKVNSRVMVDKVTYRDMNPNLDYPSVNVFPDVESATGPETAFSVSGAGSVSEELSEEQLLMATPLLYGFSLSDKLWLMFSVDGISDIQWQTDAFDNLVLPKEQKDLIKALVENHEVTNGSQNQFDDFIVGKGRGLVINLFGPPGVGKTLSAEATSEYVRRPLYVAGVDEVTSKDVERSLKKIFQVASIWKAIVLIDEADVFLERRSVHDLNRNALVAVFLRRLEYYEGVLFLTTNRVKVFDEAFQSRIHISLRYRELSTDAKRQIWFAFLQKVGMDSNTLTESEWSSLAEANVNGRQIRNAVRSCQGLAVSRGEPMSFGHIQEVLSIVQQFEKDFQEEKQSDLGGKEIASRCT